LGGRKGIRPVKTEWWGAGAVICLEQGADLHTAQLMPLPLTVSCFSKIQIGVTFLVPAHPGSPGQRAAKRVCVSVCVRVNITSVLRQPCYVKLANINHYSYHCEYTGTSSAAKANNRGYGLKNEINTLI